MISFRVHFCIVQFGFYGMATGGVDTGSGMEENGGQASNSLPQWITPETLRNHKALNDNHSDGIPSHGQESQSNIMFFCYFLCPMFVNSELL